MVAHRTLGQSSFRLAVPQVPGARPDREDGAKHVEVARNVVARPYIKEWGADTFLRPEMSEKTQR